MQDYKGIILAGGTGTRLGSLTKGVSKQLLPVYDTPMIYYSISVLMLSGIRDIAIITNPEHINSYKILLDQLEPIGLNFELIPQKKPEGIAQAYLLAENFLCNKSSMMILGDNIFYGSGFSGMLSTALQKNQGANIFGYKVHDPEHFGIAELNHNNEIIGIEEKPKKPRSNIAVTGLYIFDNTASKRAKSIKPSVRGELEITSLVESYLFEKKVEISILPRGFAWLDTGNPDSLLEASHFVHTVQKRQGMQIACLEEIALQNNWISSQQLQFLIDSEKLQAKKDYLIKVLSYYENTTN